MQICTCMSGTTHEIDKEGLQQGLCEVPLDAYQRCTEATHLRIHKKRKLSHTGLEIPDSEDDEDYGWAEEDEASMPGPPPQWQGSEDILLGQDVGHSDEAEDEDDEDEPEVA